MYGPNETTTEAKPTGGYRVSLSRKNARYSSTAEIRALLCDLKMRPQSQRRILCRMLRRAAVYASTTNSAVNPVEAHHISTP